MVTYLVVRILYFLFEKGLHLRWATFIQLKLKHFQESSDPLTRYLEVTAYKLLK